MSFYVLIPYFFLELANIPLSGCAIVHLYIHLFYDVLVASKVLSIMTKAALNFCVQIFV